jgi:hypothetical protein
MRKTCTKPVKNRLDTGPHPEPPTGIDPVTSFLPRTRSTTELGGQRVNTLPEDFATNKSASGQVKGRRNSCIGAQLTASFRPSKLGQAEHLSGVDHVRIRDRISVGGDERIQVHAELHRYATQGVPGLDHDLRNARQPVCGCRS